MHIFEYLVFLFQLVQLIDLHRFVFLEAGLINHLGGNADFPSFVMSIFSLNLLCAAGLNLVGEGGVASRVAVVSRIYSPLHGLDGLGELASG